MISRRKSYSWHHQCKRSPISAPFKIEVDIKTPREPYIESRIFYVETGMAFALILTIVEVTVFNFGLGVDEPKVLTAENQGFPPSASTDCNCLAFISLKSL